MSTREIKFRAWNADDKVMHHNWKQLDTNFDLMQFTGLLDKNGKEVFEGDIVKNESGEVAQIIYSTDSGILGGFTYAYKNLPKGVFDWENEKGEREIWFEVIGNIYQDGDLLK